MWLRMGAFTAQRTMDIPTPLATVTTMSLNSMVWPMVQGLLCLEERRTMGRFSFQEMGTF